MNDKNALAITDEEIKSEGHRIKTLLPGGNKLTDNQAAALGFYGKATDANAMRGEVYGYSDGHGGFKIIDGYKLLVRWAKEQCDYDEEYYILTAEEKKEQRIDQKALAYRCEILRHDKYKSVKFYMDIGKTYTEAMAKAITSAVGIVDEKELKGSPPKTWSWAQVSKKRALRTALNFAYAMPSISELARKYLDVDGTQTEPEDWEGVEIYDTGGEQRQAAKVNAWGREAEEKREAMDPEDLAAESQRNIDLMRGTIEDDETALGEEPDREEIAEGVVIVDEEIEADPPAPPAEAEVTHYAKIKHGVKWGQVTRDLAEACPAYALPNSKPNMSLILASAWDNDFKEITSENVGDVLSHLSDMVSLPKETDNE